MKPELHDQFCATTYDSPPWALRIGEPCPEVGADRWAFVTACNPDAQRQDPAANSLAMTQLKAELDAAGWRWQDGEGVANDGSWREASVLVFGMGRAEALALGRRWRQVAVLVGQRGGIVELVAMTEAP